MSENEWAAVDQFITDQLVPGDPALDAALRASTAAGLPPINITPNQGKLLNLLARVVSASAILEIGTLGGYSTIWLARGLRPGGRVITLESEAKHAEVASASIAAAGLAHAVDVRLGKALDTLPILAAELRSPFDLVFIDADKANNPAYFTWALRLSRPGTVIVVDNVVRQGSVIDAASTDPDVQGTRQLYELLAAEAKVDATVVQTVGSKGYDGFAIALVTDVPDVQT